MCFIEQVTKFSGGRMQKSKSISRRVSSKRGQAVVEYALLLACLSFLSITFVKFIGEKIFSAGLQKDRLPTKVSACLSHGKGLNCQ